MITIVDKRYVVFNGNHNSPFSTVNPQLQNSQSSIKILLSVKCQQVVRADTAFHQPQALTFA
jgi:hypothetical protein